MCNTCLVIVTNCVSYLVILYNIVIYMFCVSHSSFVIFWKKDTYCNCEEKDTEECLCLGEGLLL